MDLSIIIVNYNVCDKLANCIKSIKDNLIGYSYEIITVDNNSDECNVKNILLLFPDVKLLKLNENIGFGAANNIAMKNAAGRYFLLINPDITIKDDCIQKLVTFLDENPKIGVVAPVLFKPNGRIDYYYPYFPSMRSIILLQSGLYNSSRWMKKRTRDYFDFNISKGKAFLVEQAMGACILTRKSIYENIGGFDEAFFLYQEETDYEYRMTKNGWEIMVLPDSVAIHDHHSSTNKLGKMFVGFHWLRSITIFYSKHFNIIQRMILKINMTIFLTLREFKYLILYFYKPKSLLMISHYTFLLFMYNLFPRKYLIQNRFRFKNSTK